MDSDLCCDADEVFVCVRDRRTTAEEPPAFPRILGRCGEDEDEGALFGDGSPGGCRGMVGRFAAGDSGSDMLSVTNDANPGEPVRPPYRGWLFKVPQTALLQGIVDRIRSELQPLSEPFKCASSYEVVKSPSNTFMPAQPQPTVQSEADDELLLPPCMPLYFVAVAPHFHASSSTSSSGCTSLRSQDTPMSATMRAAFGNGPHPQERVAAVDTCTPLHILEVHDFESYTAKVWAH